MTMYMGDNAFLFYFRKLRKPIVTKQQIYRPKRLSSKFPPKPLMPRGHRDALGFILSLAPQRPYEVLGQAQNFRSQF